MSNFPIQLKPTKPSSSSNPKDMVIIVDDLESGGKDKALSAEQGKILKDMIVQSGSSGTNNIPNMTGPTGPQGPIGMTGPTGPQGPIGSLDLTTEYSQLITNSKNIIDAINELASKNLNEFTIRDIEPGETFSLDRNIPDLPFYDKLLLGYSFKNINEGDTLIKDISNNLNDGIMDSEISKNGYIQSNGFKHKVASTKILKNSNSIEPITICMRISSKCNIGTFISLRESDVYIPGSTDKYRELITFRDGKLTHHIAGCTLNNQETDITNKDCNVIVTIDSSIIKFYIDGVLVLTSSDTRMIGTCNINKKLFLLNGFVENQPNASGMTSPNTHKLYNVLIYNKILKESEILEVSKLLEVL